MRRNWVQQTTGAAAIGNQFIPSTFQLIKTFFYPVIFGGEDLAGTRSTAPKEIQLCP